MTGGRWVEQMMKRMPEEHWVEQRMTEGYWLEQMIKRMPEGYWVEQRIHQSLILQYMPTNAREDCEQELLCYTSDILL